MTNAGTKSLATERLSISVLSAANVVLPHTDYVGIFNGTKKHLRQKKRNKLDLNQLSKHAQYHQQTKRRLSQKLQFRCRRCSEVFNNRHYLYLHGRRQHFNQYGGALQPRPWGRHEVTPLDGNDALREVYDANAPLILENHNQGPLRSVYNFPLTNDVNLNQLMGFAEDIYRQQDRAFRLSAVFGMILQNRETGRYRYFIPYNNNGIFERPLYISRRVDLQRFRRELERKDIMTELLRNRPDTRWIPVLVTNVHFVIYSTYYPLGHGKLPDFLLKKASLYPLVKNRHNGKLYKDHFCAFRCLALHRGYEIRCIDGPAKQLFRQWTDDSEEDFEGLSFEDFPEFETRFQMNLEVYSLTEDGFATPSTNLGESMRPRCMSTSSRIIYHTFETLLSTPKSFSARAVSDISIMPEIFTNTKKDAPTRPSSCTREGFIKIGKTFLSD